MISGDNTEGKLVLEDKSKVGKDVRWAWSYKDLLRKFYSKLIFKAI